MSTDEEFFNIIQRSGFEEEGMLNDLHMSRFMQMMPSINMQCTLFLNILQFINQNVDNNEFIQILFRGPNNTGHWIYIWYDTIVIRVYDSLNECLHDDHKKYINRLFPNHQSLNVIYETVQLQQQPYNCGLFAIAFAISISNGICPCNLIFDETKMRDHLINIFKRKQIEIFPIIYNKIHGSRINNYSNENFHSNGNSQQFHHLGNQLVISINMNNYSKFYELQSQNYNNKKNKVIEIVDLQEKINNRNFDKNVKLISNYKELHDKNDKSKSIEISADKESHEKKSCRKRKLDKNIIAEPKVNEAITIIESSKNSSSEQKLFLQNRIKKRRENSNKENESIRKRNFRKNATAEQKEKEALRKKESRKNATVEQKEKEALRKKKSRINTTAEQKKKKYLKKKNHEKMALSSRRKKMHCEIKNHEKMPLSNKRKKKHCEKKNHE